MNAAQPRLFEPPSPLMPPGFLYQPELIGAADEKALVKHLAHLAFQPFEFRGYLGKRQVVVFGWRYDYDKRKIEPALAIPQFLMPLRARAAAFAGVEPDALVQALINRYEPGAGIGWHRDKPMFGTVIAVSLLSPCTLRLRRRCGGGFERIGREVAARSAYRLQGPSRTEWEHSILSVDDLRYSVTFRTFAEGVDQTDAR
jgi:alkylated DNA repair dioxygenase AlkB